MSLSGSGAFCENISDSRQTCLDGSIGVAVQHQHRNLAVRQAANNKKKKLKGLHFFLQYRSYLQGIRRVLSG